MKKIQGSTCTGAALYLLFYPVFPACRLHTGRKSCGPAAAYAVLFHSFFCIIFRTAQSVLRILRL